MIKLSMVITLMAVAMITWVGWVWPEMTTMIMKGIFETKKNSGVTKYTEIGSLDLQLLVFIRFPLIFRSECPNEVHQSCDIKHNTCN